MRVFVIAPAVKAGSSIFSWLLGQHSVFGGQAIHERIELGAMLNVLDHIPEWRENGWTTVGDEPMLRSIRQFADAVANPEALPTYGVKFTNFYSLRWLSHVFPDDRVIVVVRNIFDWYASIKLWNTKRHGGWQQKTIDHYLLSATDSLQALPRIKIVHLEDLIMDTQSVMHKVHDHLGIAQEPIDLAGHAQIFSRYTSVPADIQGTSHVLRKEPIGRRSHLSQSELESISDLVCKSGITSVLYDQNRRLR